MDKELIAYFDERFREIREESARQFERIDARLERIEIRLDRVDERLDRVEERLDRVEERLDKTEEAVRHTQILVEGLRSDTRQLAEGIIGFEQRMEDLRGEFKQQF